MPGVVLVTLFTAGLANLGAQFTELSGKFTPSGHPCSGQSADVGTMCIQLDAAGHNFYVFLFQARRCAMVTRSDTCLAGFNTG